MMLEDLKLSVSNIHLLLIFSTFFLCFVCEGLLRAETGQLVLAGDPKQLGPILRSRFAIKYGLGEPLVILNNEL